MRFYFFTTVIKSCVRELNAYRDIRFCMASYLTFFRTHTIFGECCFYQINFVAPNDVIVLDIQSVYSVISRERKVKLERARGTELRVESETRRLKRSGRKRKTIAPYAKKKRE